MEKLREFLAILPAGLVVDPRELAGLLAPCLGEFAGWTGRDVEDAELAERIQRAVWRPPFLKIAVGTGVESSPGVPSGPAQEWELDLNTNRASLAKPPPRPFQPTRPKFNMPELAEQVARLIQERRQDPRLRWYSDGSVRFAVGIMFPEGAGFKQTVSNRRRKFRLAMDEKLTAAGWRRVKDYVYAPPAA